MVKFISRVGGNTGRFLVLATVATVLTACGGSSGDSDPGVYVDADGDDFDDITGLPQDEFAALYGGDVFVDADGDGLDDITGYTEEQFAAQLPPVVEGDNDGDGFTDITVATPCGGETGAINDGGAAAWNDNCEVRRNGQFANSRYSVGVQRIIYCSGFGAGATYADFADGIFGGGTEAAVQEFQRADLSPDAEDGLDTISDDGRVGPQTWAKLQARIELLTSGDIVAGVPDSHGFSTGRCAGIPLFYQSVTANAANDGVVYGGWMLARNQPNEAESIVFTKDPVGGL